MRGIRFEKWLTAMCTEERLCNWPIWTSTSYTCICYLSVWSKRTNPLVRVHSIFEVSIQVGQLSQVQHGSLSKTHLHISYQLSRKPSKNTNLSFSGKEKKSTEYVWKSPIGFRIEHWPWSVFRSPVPANWKVVNLDERSWMLTNHIRLRLDGWVVIVTADNECML